MRLPQALGMNPVKLKRADWEMWITPESQVSHPITIADMQADDWELEEKTVLVSRTQLINLVNKHLATDFNLNKKFEFLCKDLGLL